MGDLEFRIEPPPRAEEPSGEPALDDVVELAPRSVPAWALLAAGVCVSALLVAAVVVRARPAERPPAAREPAPVATSARPLPPLPVSQVGRTVRHNGDHIALDVAVAGDVLYTLRYNLLTAADAHTGNAIAQAQVRGLDYFYGGPMRHLFLDARTRTAWVLSAGVSPPRVLEFDSASLRQRRALVAPGMIYDADTMDGHLYLATSNGVAVLTPNAGSPRLVPGARGRYEAIAADPLRSRILAVDAAAPQHVLVMGPDGAPAIPIRIAQAISPSLAVVQGHIWLAGYNENGPLVWRLDPVSLRPVLSSPVTPRAGAGARLVAGDAVVWISNGGGARKQELWCLAADSGAIGGYWPALSGAVSSRAGLAFAVRGAEVVGLPTSLRCRG